MTHAPLRHPADVACGGVLASFKAGERHTREPKGADMNPNLNWGQHRAADLLAEAERDRQARQAQRQARQPAAWNLLRFLLPARRPRLI
ncbi:hypothetical protein [Deinococcus cavernae]|uniref:hypothetical protein n=1 Tax=Deinococcus cavernae TaxID=2320857 RepID=UPI0011C21D90|nr:hypothetical protein [Deinococcus cavernae]